MRRLIPLIVCLCLLSVLLCACEGEPAPPADGALTPVTDDTGNITGYERKYHNDSGDITRWDRYDENEQYIEYVLYEYDSSGRLAQETTYAADGIGQFYYAYSYDEDGNLAEKDYCTMKEGSERTLYVNGAESERLTFDKYDVLIKYEVSQNGAWVEADLPTETPTEE